MTSESAQSDAFTPFDHAFMALVNAVMEAADDEGVTHDELGYLLNVEEGSVSGFGFALSPTGHAPWMGGGDDMLTMATQLWEQMGREWSAILLYINTQTNSASAEFLTSVEVSQALSDEFDYEGALRLFHTVFLSLNESES